MKYLFLFIPTLFFLASCWKTVTSTTSSDSTDQLLDVTTKQFVSRFWTDKFKSLLGNKDYTVIDIRTADEIKNWFIEWTNLNIDFYSDSYWDDLLKLDKTKKYLIYCAHWNRTIFSLDFMSKNWFLWVADLEPWFDGWKEAWEKVVTK